MLRIEDIGKSYDGHTVLSKLSVSVNKGEVLSILGKSGCGKTTMLKIIAGLLDHTEGTIEMNGLVINNIPAHLRQIVYLYQEPMLFPHLDVYSNLAFGLKIRKEKNAIIIKKVAQIAEELELSAHLKKMPDQLSGGQKQRVAFGRALVLNPRVLLLDEPFGNLDAQTRAAMQSLFQKMAKEHSITAIFVTHDLKEALVVGTKFGLLEAGQLVVYDSKEQFIGEPKTGIRSEIDFWQQLIQLNG